MNTHSTIECVLISLLNSFASCAENNWKTIHVIYGLYNTSVVMNIRVMDGVMIRGMALCGVLVSDNDCRREDTNLRLPLGQ